MDKNKELALKLGISPHESVFGEEDGVGKRPRDFTTPDGIHLLLREMKKRPDWNKFLDFISVKYCSTHYATLEEAFELILEPGKLRDAALEFLLSEEHINCKPYSAPATRWNKENQSGE